MIEQENFLKKIKKIPVHSGKMSVPAAEDPALIRWV